jgi:hypothetical protein
MANATANATSTTVMPAATSMTKWFAVARTANVIAAGERAASARTARCEVVRKRTTPTARFQPTCRLGSAAYWFVSPGGWSAR